MFVLTAQLYYELIYKDEKEEALIHLLEITQGNHMRVQRHGAGI